MDDTKTTFKGPGQWRSQAARLEAETAKKKPSVVESLYERAKRG